MNDKSVGRVFIFQAIRKHVKSTNDYSCLTGFCRRVGESWFEWILDVVKKKNK